MKKNFLKKHNNLTVLIAVSIISVLIPSSLSVIVQADGVASFGSSAGTQGTITGYIEDHGTHHYVEPNSFKGSGSKMTIESGGKKKEYNLYETQADVEAAKAKGLCENVECKTGAEMGFEGPRETWPEQLEDAGNSAGGNGISFDLSDPVALAYYKEALEMQGYDTSSMSQEEIEAAATKIAKETGKFTNTELEQHSVVRNTSTGRYFYCPGDSECVHAKEEGFAVTAILDMAFDKAKTNDEGWLSEHDIPDCPEGNCYDVPDIEVIDFELKPESCEVDIPVIPTPEPKPIPGDSSSGGDCGTTASKTTNTTSTAGCGYIVMLTTETVTAHLPSAPSVVYAGEAFNWGKVSSVKNVSTLVWDTSQLEYEQTKTNSQIEAFESAKECVNKAKNKLKEEYTVKISECVKAAALAEEACSSCTSSCNKVHDENPNAECTCDNSCSAAVVQEKICDDLNETMTKYIREYENQIEGYNEDIALLKEQIDYLDTCSKQVTGVGARTETDTVQITNQKMKLSTGYVQIINTIKGVAKNSGMPLTAEEIAKIDTDTYLPIKGNFFIPYYVKNGTSGNLIGDIVGDIWIPGYNCPINVSNYVLCEEENCETPSNIDIIYRPISLTNPFPDVNKTSSYRPMGSNWDEIYAEIFITNNRGVKDYDIYNLTPIYTITLTPSTIKEIRNYNKQNSLNDFDMDCTDGYNCSSKFLWEKFDGIIDTSNSCASSTGWDASCYDGGVSE